MNAAARPAQVSEKLLALGLQRGRYRETVDGLEKRCSECREYWPADTEFFYACRVGDCLGNYCKACYVKRRDLAEKHPDQQPREQQQPEQQLTPREEATMIATSIPDEELLKLIRMRPKILATQVSDLLDIDLDVAEARLAALLRTTQILVEKVPAANGLEAKAYSINPGYLNWSAPARPPAAQPAAAAAPTAPTAQALAEQTEGAIALKPAAAPARRVRASGGKGPTKTQLAIDYLKAHGATDGKTLKQVMDIPAAYSVKNYLAKPIASGRVIAIEDVFSLAPEAVAAGAGTNEPAAGAASSHPAPQEEPAPLIEPGVIEILRANLEPAEYRGYLKAKAIQNILFPPKEQSAATGYKIAGIYIDLLADHVTEEAFA